MQNKKNGFPMPTAKNGFHILNLHPKIYTLKKKILFLMPIYKKNLIIFTTQKLDATVKNRFQIFILHPKKHTIEEKKNVIFYAATFTGPIPKFFDRNPAPAISGILANYAFRLYITSVFNVVIPC